VNLFLQKERNIAKEKKLLRIMHNLKQVASALQNISLLYLNWQSDDYFVE